MTDKKEEKSPKTENKKEEKIKSEEKSPKKEVKEETPKTKKEKSPSENKSFKISKTKLMLLGIGLIVGLLIGFLGSGVLAGGASGTCNEDLASEAQNYIVENYLAVQGLDAETGGIEKVGNLCKVNLSIMREGEVLQQSQIYMTPNGEQLILGQVVDTTVEVPEVTGEATNTPEEAKTSCEDLTKSDSSEMNAFVVSYCPYGLQMQRVISKLVEEAPELADYVTIRYMGAISDGKVTAMHGEEEAQENLRQICLREEQPDKFWSYLNCFMKAGETETCLAETEVDTEKLETCMTGESGLEYAQEDFDMQNQYSVSGSPTLILNGERVSEFDFGGRTAEALKTLTCCGFNTEPEVCTTEITTASAASSFSETYDGSTGTSGGSC